MRKLFIQFYLLLFVCFVVMTMLVGLVYKFTAERAGRQSLDDLMKSTLYLMRSELREIPPRDWNKTLHQLDLNLSFNLSIQPLNKFKLDETGMKQLREGNIVALDEQYTFIQRIPRSHYVLTVGPVPYLFFLHQMRLWDIAFIAFIAFSLALPVFIWIRPHWQDMLKLENVAQRLGKGQLDARVHFDNTSGFTRLGIIFNQMADNINALIASKKRLIDGVAHELRTPLVRLRYRLAMTDNLTEEESSLLHRDIGQLESLIDELLTYARLDRPQTELHLAATDFSQWLTDHISDVRLMNPAQRVELETETALPVDYGLLDLRLMARVTDNLLNNAIRYSRQRLRISLWRDRHTAYLQVEDDGPGIPDEDRLRVLEPFVRLDPSRDRATGGCGLGLAIVKSIATAMQGDIQTGSSPLGGACFCFSWPVKEKPA